MARRPARDTPSPDQRLDRALRRIAIAGAMLVLALPAARGHSQWFGALPLWLLAMPLSSLWALHGFRLPRLRAAAPETASGLRRRRNKPQALRHRQYPAASRAFSASARPISISSAARQNS
jgi:hypothetical protein